MYDKSEPIEVYKADEHAFVIEGDRVDRMLGYTNLDDEKVCFLPEVYERTGNY